MKTQKYNNRFLLTLMGVASLISLSFPIMAEEAAPAQLAGASIIALSGQELADAIKAKAIEDMERDYDIFAEALGEGPFILGPSMSAVDIYAAMLLSWAPDVSQLFARHGNIKRLYDLVAARPLIAKVWARNEMP